MGTQQILMIVVAIAVISGGAWYLTSSKDNDMSQDVSGQKTGQVVASSDEETLSGSGTIRNLIAQGRDISCNFKQTLEEGQGDVTGTVYISGDDFRGNFNLTLDGQPSETSMIHNNGTAYTWGTTPFGTMAITFSLDEEDKMSNQGDDGGPDLDETVEYECRTWKVDRSVFNPPSDVEFMNFEQQFQQMQAGEAMLEGVQCSACDNIPDPTAQAQCRVALGC